MPTMWRLITVKTSRLVMPVVDHEVAGQVHHRDHPREARDRGDERGQHARPADDLAERRGRVELGAAGVEVELLGDRARVGPDAEDERRGRRP